VWAAAFRDVWPDGRVRERRPRPSRDVADFASGCWFCPGSTALFQRRAVLETVGPFDEALARLEDLDWFLRLGLAGGGLGVSPVIAAEIARGTKAPPAVLAHAARHLAAKYASGPLALSRDNQRRLRAYLALETAASARDAGNPLSAARALVQSWLAAPRARAPLRRFWV
jgi:GT2 family glycosyltransferase